MWERRLAGVPLHMHRGKQGRRLGIHKYKEAGGWWRARKSFPLHSRCALEKVTTLFTEVSVTLGSSGGEAAVQLGTVCCFPGKKTSCFLLHHYSCGFMVLTLPQLFAGRLLPDESQIALGPA